MNLVSKILSLATVSALFFSCKGDSKFPDLDKQDSGSYFKRVTEGKGVALTDGMLMFGHQIVKNQKDSILDDYRTAKNPGPQMVLEMGKAFYKGDMMELLKGAKVGDSLVMALRIDSFFGKPQKRPIPKFLDSTGYLKFELKIDSAWSIAKFNDYKKMMEAQQKLMQEEQMKQQAEYEKMAAENEGKEAGVIKDLLKKYSVSSKPTATGLYIKQVKKGSGAKVQMGDATLVHYTGYFADGKVFDSSVQRGEPYQLQSAGMDQVISAWNEAILTMSEGDKIIIVAPSKICYGPQGNQGIPPFTPLVFEMEMVKVEKKK